MSNKEEDSRAKKILAAIENQKYKSRTIDGIAKETGISTLNVKREISTNSFLNSKVMAIPGIKKNGQPLFVTVERYKRETPIAVRVLNLLKNKEYFNE